MIEPKARNPEEPEREHSQCMCLACMMKAIMGEDFMIQMMLARIEESISEEGFHTMFIDEDEETRDYAYTVGMCRHGLPELCTVGMIPPTAQTCFEMLYRRREEWKPDCEIKLAQNFSVRLQREDKLVEDMRWSRAYRETFHENAEACVYQVVFPDVNGKFPGDEGFDDRFCQDLHRKTD